ncbi:MAG: YceI family protein [Crocinitomicaceae bacterium]|nr:YceI family protein [Crocinitomicaceae bacterium]
MKTKILAFAALAFTLGLSSCGDAAKDTDGEETGKNICVYSYNEGSTDFEWTSYKTSAKVPVAGSFNEITVTSESSEDPLEVIESIQFTMNTASVETTNEERNGKIAKHFFGTIETPEITGKVASVNEETGKAAITVTMHGISIDIEGDYLMEDGTFSWTSSIDVSSWNGMAGIIALNTICSDLHTGDDGVSKLWSEIGLRFSTTLVSDCD